MSFWLLNPLGNTNDEDLCFLSNFLKGLEAKSWCVYRKDSPEDARIFLARGDTGVKRSSMIGNAPADARRVLRTCPSTGGHPPEGMFVPRLPSTGSAGDCPLDTRPPWRIAAR
jgi:hypothetical protein